MLQVFVPQGEALKRRETPNKSGKGYSLEPGVWIDLLDPDHDEMAVVEEHLGIELPSFETMREIEATSRLYMENGTRYMTVTAVAGLSRDKAGKTPITFVLAGGKLVTIRHMATKTFDNFIATAEKGGFSQATTGETVMLTILEAIIDRLADALERISELVDEVSMSVFRASNLRKEARNLQVAIEDIGHQGDMLSSIQEAIISIRRLVAFYEGAGAPERKPGKDARQRLEMVQQDTGSLIDHVGFLNDKIAFLLNATLGLINLEQNQTIKMFSVVAVIFMPPTLIASIYGMNFKLMPELNWPWGYPMALVLMVISAVTPFLYFKHKRWL